MGLLKAEACQCAGSLFDCLFIILPLTQSEEFHQFTGQIFIRAFLAIPDIIQIIQHRRIFHDHLHQITKITGGQLSQLHILARQHNHRTIINTVIGRDKMIMPEQHKPFRLW